MCQQATPQPHTNPACSSPSAGHAVCKYIYPGLWIRLMAVLTGTVSAFVVTHDWGAAALYAQATKTATAGFCKYSLQAVGKKTKFATDRWFTHQFSQFFFSPPRPPILVCSSSNKGFLVVSRSKWRLCTCPAQVESNTEVVMTGSEALCRLKFICQTPAHAPCLSLSLSLSLLYTTISSAPPSVCQGWWLAVTLCRGR